MGNLTKNTITRGAVVALALSAGAATTANAAVTRVSGATRYTTADAVVNAGWASGSSNAILASGLDANEVDALTVAPLAKKLSAPVVLVDPSATTASIVAKFTALNTTTVYIANGTGVISANVETALKAAGITVTRLGGLTRYQTALNIAKEMGASDNIVIANGEDAHLVDSLSIASIAAVKGMPIFLTSPTSLDASVKTYIDGLSAKKTYVLGGTTLVSDAVAASLPAATRLAGAGRYETNAAVITAFKNDSSLSFNNLYIASGEDANLIDALAGAPLAAKNSAPIVLAHNNINADVNTLLNSVLTTTTNMTILGGTGAVSEAVNTSLQTLQAAKNTKLVVKSVSALNASQIQIVYSAPVDKATAETLSNYTITAVGGNVTLAVNKYAQLQSDNTTVILTLPAGYADSTDLVVVAKNVQAKDDSTSVIPLYTSSITIDDNLAPTAVSITSKTNDDTATTAEVTFSEPIFTGSIKIDGNYVMGAATAVPGAATYSTNKVSLIGLSLDATKSHTLQVVNLTDAGTNVTSSQTLTFNITSDKAAPTVSSVTVKSDSSVDVLFNKDMDKATGEAGISLKGEDFADIPVTATQDADDAKLFHVVINTPANTFANKDTRTLTVAFADTIADSLGNTMALTSKVVTVAKDKTAPVVTALSFTKNADGEVTAVVATFSENVIYVADPTVVDKDGALINGFFNNAPVVSSNKITYNLATPAKETGTWTFNFAAGAVQDKASSANDNASTNKTIDFGTGTTSAFKLVLANTPVTVPGADDVYEIDFGVAVKGGAVTGSATNPIDYTLNGTTLPAGTTITLDSATKHKATITIPAGFIAKDDAKAVFTISNVQNTDGVVITPYTQEVAAVDNTKPVLKSAVVAGDTITLTFSENVDSATLPTNLATLLAALEIKCGGTTVVNTAGTATIVPLAGAANKVVLSFVGTNFNSAKTITVKVLTDTITDASAGANVLTTGTLITATK